MDTTESLGAMETVPAADSMDKTPRDVTGAMDVTSTDARSGSDTVVARGEQQANHPAQDRPVKRQSVVEVRSDTLMRVSTWLQTRDDVLAAELCDLLAHDRRTAGLSVAVNVDGGVAHVRGEVPDEAQRRLVGALLRRHGGLDAVWDLLALPGQTLAVLDVGCGGQKQIAGAVGLDCVPLPGVDVVADLEGRLPFDDDAFDHIFAVHVLEHIRDLLGVMRDLHRVLRPTGVLHILTPYWRNVNAVADPTHVRLMDIQTLRYFTQRRPGVLPWRPLLAHQTDDTVFGDMQPIKDGAAVSRGEIARWFY